MKRPDYGDATPETTLPIEIGPVVRLLLEPYEMILDRLFAEGRISESERELFRKQVLSAQERLFADPMRL